MTRFWILSNKDCWHGYAAVPGDGVLPAEVGYF